jgi:hypothetical protein
VVRSQSIAEKSSILDISMLSKGMYLLNISTENGFAITRIVKK